MQLPLHVLSPKQRWDAIQGIIRQRNATKTNLPSEKTMGFQLLSPKTRQRRSLFQQNFLPQTVTTLVKQLSDKQTDLPNGFVENKLQIHET